MSNESFEKPLEKPTDPSKLEEYERKMDLYKKQHPGAQFRTPFAAGGRDDDINLRAEVQSGEEVLMKWIVADTGEDIGDSEKQASITYALFARPGQEN